MGRELADEFPVAGNLFLQADEILGRKLSEITWNGPIEELTKTSNCQPALFVHGLACLAALREMAGDFPVTGAAGLSLGEMTAHAAGGTFDFPSGLKLVQKRGQLMDEACAATSGGMAAMIGAAENSVRQLAADEDVDVANINAPGQIVISGELAKVEAAVGVAKEHGIRRATMLNVAGAYHSRLMDGAYRKLGPALLEVEMQPPRFPVISNVTGQEAATLPEIRQTLQDQVTSTVRWVDCMERLLSMGCELFIELGPGGVLAGLLQRIRKGVEVMSVSDPESVRACVERMRIGA
jgi:[acyl-carrier-protein] S-malonyltransferase